MMNVPEQQVILICGAGQPPGTSIAQALAQPGKGLALHGLSPINLKAPLIEVKKLGGAAQEYVYDPVKKMPVQALVNHVLDDWGRIDVLVNSLHAKPEHSILTMDEWDWHRTIDFNLSAPFFLIQSVARVMREQGSGVIVNIVECHRHVGEQPSPLAYAASQAALVALTEASARELDSHHIRVNAICPHNVTGGEVTQDAWNKTIRFLCAYPSTITPGKLFHPGEAMA